MELLVSQRKVKAVKEVEMLIRHRFMAVVEQEGGGSSTSELGTGAGGAGGSGLIPVGGTFTGATRIGDGLVTITQIACVIPPPPTPTASPTLTVSNVGPSTVERT
jgi:hypothetical protein